jgi:hypothetical protein
MQRLIENGWACGGALALKVVSLARNRVISSVSLVGEYVEGWFFCSHSLTSQFRSWLGRLC